MNEAMERFSLQGKVALVTGAARGLGAAIVRALAAAGARVMLGDQDAVAVDATAARIQQAGGNVLAAAHDVRNEAQWESAVQGTIDRLGGLDIVVNNAGIARPALFVDASVDDFREVNEVNATGVFLGLKHAARAMRPGGAAGQGGVVINLSSVAGQVGVPGLGAYCASKGAVRLMSKAAAVEFAALGYGIRVHSVHPAIVPTDMGMAVIHGMARIGLAPDTASAQALMASLHPMGYGQPHDVADAVLFLASGASRWMNGSELVLDGGFSAR